MPHPHRPPSSGSWHCDLLPALLLGLGFCLTGCTPGEDTGTAAGGPSPPIVRTETGIEMVQLPGGWFEMGDRRDADGDAPLHRVRVDAFLIDRYEVTQEVYRRLEVSDVSRRQGEGLPVEQQTWAEAARFCNLRSYLEGLEPCYDEDAWVCDFTATGYRLPTEAEWEYACRAGSTGRYFFGEDPSGLRRHAWFADNSGGRTQTVGTRRPNPWGLFDMYGNVAEWCNDFYAEEYYRTGPERNPRGPVQGGLRVVRGGSWDSPAAAATSSFRSNSASVDDTCLLDDTIGFRCVRSVPGTPETR